MQTQIYTMAQREINGSDYIAFNARSTQQNPVAPKNRHRGIYLEQTYWENLGEVAYSEAARSILKQACIAEIRAQLSEQLANTEFTLPDAIHDLLDACVTRATASEAITGEMVNAWFPTSATAINAGTNAAKLQAILVKLAARNYHGACNPATAAKALTMLADADITQPTMLVSKLVQRLNQLAENTEAML